MRAVRTTLGHSGFGMKLISAGLSFPKALRTMSAKARGTSIRPKKLSTTRNRSGGRITAISGSRPTMMVSLWWRAWLQRQVTGLRMIMKQAIW